MRRSGRIRIRDGDTAELSIYPEKDADVTISIGKGCDVRTTIVMETRVRLSLTIDVGEGSVSRCASLALCGSEINTKSLLSGKGAKAHDTHMFIQKGGMEFRLDSHLGHIAKDTEGDVLVKGVAFGHSEAKLSGLIKIGKRASGAKSHLSEHVLLMGEDARADANPTLEIENNDVSSRHSATVSRVGSEKIFYMMSRGLSQADAERLAVSGFLESAAMRIGGETARGDIIRRMEKAL